MRANLRIAGCLPALALLAGCVSIPAERESLGGYARGQSFESRERLALVRSDDGHLSKVPALTTIGRRRTCRATNLFGVDQAAVDRYCGDSLTCAANDRDIMGTVPAGSVITVRRVVVKQGWNIMFGRQDDMSVYGDVQTPGALHRNIELIDLSVWLPGGDEVRVAPDPALLAPRSPDTPLASANCVLASPSP